MAFVVKMSAVIRDALRLARKDRLKKEFTLLQGYRSKKAKENILTEKDLQKYLGK